MASARTLTAKQRKERAKNAANIRWQKKKEGTPLGGKEIELTNGAGLVTHEAELRPLTPLAVYIPDSPAEGVTGYVYLIWQESTSYYKIGVAKNPKARLRHLQTSHAGTLYLLGIIPCIDSYRKEQYLHSKYGQHRRAGEWFNFSPWVLAEIFADFSVIDLDIRDTPVYAMKAEIQRLQGVVDALQLEAAKGS